MLTTAAKSKLISSNKKSFTSEQLFKYINITLLSVLIFCVKGFWDFRHLCIEKGIYVFSLQSGYWCVVGFIGRFIIKYTYLNLAHNTMDRLLVQKQQTQSQRQYRLKSLKKLSFDFVFYVGISVWAYYLFKNQYWFPQAAFGQGQCNAIYRQYPNWPSNKTTSTNMQIYFMVQMGIHLFSLFQLIFIIGPSYRKYHQFLLHHCVTITLILFSMMSNQIAAGVIIIIVHDFSDIFSSAARGFVQTRGRDSIVMVFLFLSVLFSWIYMRTIVYPFCILAQVWANIPKPTDLWYIINFQYRFLLGMAIVLVFMHAFWIYFMFQFGYKKIKKEKVVNPHQEATPAKKEY